MTVVQRRRMRLNFDVDSLATMLGDKPLEIPAWLALEIVVSPQSSMATNQNSLLIVENDPRDTLAAADVARSLGLDQLRTFNAISRTVSFLEGCIEGRASLPDVILLDLDLGQESGYELLRIWKITPRLSAIPLVVWSILGDHHRELCDIFKVTAFVPKWQGRDALREGLLACLDQRPRHLPGAAAD